MRLIRHKTLKDLHRRIRTLEAENAKLKQVSGEICNKCGWAFKFPQEECCKCKAERLETENKRLVEALEKYGVHDIECPFEATGIKEMHCDTCTCGLNQFLPSAEGKESKIGTKEWYDEMAELEDKATCPHGFLVGCPTCTQEMEGKED